MFDAFDIVLLALLAVPIMKGLHLAPAQLALVFSIQLAAAALGGIVVGTLADYIGRRRAMMINILVYSRSTGLILFAHSLSTLLALRFFTGLGLGGEWGLGMTLIAERMPDSYRGRAVAFGNIGWPFGTLLAAVFAYFIDPALDWRHHVCPDRLPGSIGAVDARLRAGVGTVAHCAQGGGGTPQDPPHAPGRRQQKIRPLHRADLPGTQFSY